MPTIRRVPDPYITIQAAHDAANPGDTILIAPGTYARVVGNKFVHLIGDTDDPINNPVLIQNGTGFSGTSIVWSFPSNTVGEWWTEGITCGYGSSDVKGAVYLTGNWPVGMRWVANRCIFSGATIIDDSTTPIGITWYNVQQVAGGISTNLFYIKGTADNSIILEKTRILLIPISVSNFSDTEPELWLDWVTDVVNADTVDYGPAYGEFLFADTPLPYRIAGTIEFYNASPDDTQVKLYKAATNGMEDTAWSNRAPDPTTGAWEFNYLPSDGSYYVAIVPPAGYEPKLLGPYTPVQT